MAKCKYCRRDYYQEWTKNIHEKLCGEKEVALKKHPERYKGVKKK